MKVIQLARAQGPLTAYAVAQRALETPIVLGYSCAGEVIAIGKGVDHVRVGDIVACAGQGHASHAEVVCVPKRLCVPVPAGLDADTRDGIDHVIGRRLGRPVWIIAIHCRV